MPIFEGVHIAFVWDGVDLESFKAAKYHRLYNFFQHDGGIETSLDSGDCTHAFANSIMDWWRHDEDVILKEKSAFPMDKIFFWDWLEACYCTNKLIPDFHFMNPSPHWKEVTTLEEMFDKWQGVSGILETSDGKETWKYVDMMDKMESIWCLGLPYLEWLLLSYPAQRKIKALIAFEKIPSLQNQECSDVDQVNNFLNTIASLVDPTRAATNTKQISLDEPVQLGIISSVPGLSDQANNVVLLLKEVFGNVPTDLQNIMDDPSPSNVQTQLTDINNKRCLNALPSLDILWPAAAAAVGAPVPPPANRPNACATIL